MTTKKNAATAGARIARLHRRITKLSCIARGRIDRLYNRCGKKGCRCAVPGDPGHGPYFIWARLEGGRLVRTSLKPAQARIARAAFREYRRLKQLSRKWEDISREVIQAGKP